MVGTVFRLFALIALVLMPFGMRASPAMAQTMPADHVTASLGHCEEPDGDQLPLSKPGDCTAMCSAIAAHEIPRLAPALKPHAPRSVALAAPFIGVEPELATPPPKTV